MMKRNKDSVEQRETACQIRDLYSRFGVEIGALAEIAAGPSVSGYEFELTPDTKISKITKLRDDISLMLSVPKVRLICPTPNKASFVIEVPNKKRKFVEFDEVFRSEAFQGAADGLRIVLGKDLSDEPVCFDLSRAPHLLIGGAACSGKTTLLKTILCSLILRNSPAELKLLLMAPEGREYEVFEASEHLLSPVICEKAAALERLNALVGECEERIKRFAGRRVRNIDAYNEIADEKLHKIVAVIDEFSFLTSRDPTAFESAVSRLAALGRMAGIHVILATKALNAKNVTGIIKANVPARIALSVQNAMESRTIIDSCDAECLLTKGDLLLCHMLKRPQRIQAAYLTDEQIKEMIRT